jgi:hypothetical protein
MDRLQYALEAAGVEFTNGDKPGVRLTKTAAALPVKPPSAPKPVVTTKSGRSKSGKTTR